MHADAHYTIGTTHLECQDYALAGDLPGGAYAIIADGCSSSARSDVGARLLCSALERSLRHGEGPSAPLLLQRALAGAALLGLDPGCLDATLGYAHGEGDTIRAVLFGDGVIAAERLDGTVEAWEIDFSGNAPAYLGYLGDEARRQSYLDADPRRTVRHWTDTDSSEHTGSLNVEPFAFERTLPLDRYRCVMLLSDGAGSFFAGERRVALPAVLARLFAFGPHRGRFVARRCRRFVGRECARLGWQHRDDLAVAALCACTAAADRALEHEGGGS